MASQGEYERWLPVVADQELLFADVYERQAELGRGATSIVYKLRHRKSGEFFAGKVVKKSTNPRAVRTEISILLRLNHPNVIRLHEIYETPVDVTLVLEYVTGGEMFDRIVTKGYYSERDAVHALRQILEALQYLHENGIVHRDLKPENLLYEDESETACLKLADFGLAKVTGSGQTALRTLCGTPGYCAPEVLSYQSYDRAVDLWSFGVIAYILLCGYEPFHDDEGPNAMFKRIIAGNYEFHSPWWDDVSMNAKDFVSALLEVNSQQRLDVRGALDHPWLAVDNATLHNRTNVVTKLKEFNAKRKLRVATRAVLASRRVMNAILSHGVSKGPSSS